MAKKLEKKQQRQLLELLLLLLPPPPLFLLLLLLFLLLLPPGRNGWDDAATEPTFGCHVAGLSALNFGQSRKISTKKNFLTI